jgi:hypothetical protein
MAYNPQTLANIQRAPRTLGTQLGRNAYRLQFSAVRIAKLTGASRQSVYNWYRGGAIFAAYKPAVVRIIEIMKSSKTGDEAWSKACTAFNRKISATQSSSATSL